MDRRSVRVRGCVALIALAGVVPGAAGQEAVVLSGGAARGLAHIGALEGMERLGWDPDLVVGNSMGAVVGALYAAGYAPDELRRLAERTDWSEMFMPEPVVLGPDRSVRFPLLRVGLDPRAGEITRGFIPDWRVNRLLVRLLFDAGARARGDFDRLPRRYRAMAADLLTGSEVALARGDLALAARASMAAPAFFSPIEWDGRLLADGGIANTLPISVARGEGADLIIAVDVSRPLPPIGRRDPVALAGRALGLLMRNAIRDTLADHLVVPEIDPDFSGVQFGGVEKLLDLGLAAALDSLPPAGEAAKPRAPSPAPESLGALTVVGAEAPLALLTRRAFRDAAPGPYRPDAVLEAVDRLYATGLVSGVWPRVVAPPPAAGGGRGAEAPALVVRVDAVPRLGLDAAAGYDNDRHGRVWGRINGRTAVLGGPAELALSGSVTGIERWGSLSVRRHSTAVPPLTVTSGISYGEWEARFFDADGRGEVDVHRGGGWLGIELPGAFPDRVLSAVVRAEHIDLPGTDDGLSVGPQVRLTTPRGQEPLVGVGREVLAEWRFGEVGYRRAEARGSLDASAGAWEGAAVLDLAAVGGDAPPDVRPALGDEHLVPGLRWGQGRGRARVVAGFDVARPFLGGNVRLRLRAGAAADEIGALDEEDAWLTGAALEAVWGSPLGMILLGVGAASAGGSRLEVNVGPRF